MPCTDVGDDGFHRTAPFDPSEETWRARRGNHWRVATMKRSAPLIGLVIAGCAGPSADHHVPTENRGATPSITALPPAPAEFVAPTPSVASKPSELGPPTRSRSWAELKHQAALRMMAANPRGVYAGPVPDPLLAIPVLEVELNADGSIRRIEVLRQPREAKDTLQLAADAVRRAAPFGEVSHLPKPWKFVETFLFNDERKFKPRSLDP